MDREVVDYFDDPENKPMPPALSLHNQLGGQRLIVAGGVHDQPAPEWFAAQRAGYIWSIVKHKCSGAFDHFKDTALTASDLETLRKLGK